MAEFERVLPAPFSDHLLPGEKVLWWDRPGQGLLLTPYDAILIPFSLLWGGIALYWEITVLREDTPSVMTLFGAVFVLVGAVFLLIALFLIVGRFILDAWLRARTYYALTDRRVLIARTSPWGAFKAIYLDRLPELSLKKASGGRGSIRFGPEVPILVALGQYGGTGFGLWVPALDRTPQFLAIADASRVFAAIQERAQAGR